MDTFRKLVIGGLLVVSALCTRIEGSARIYQLADAIVYLKDGTKNQYSGTKKLSMPNVGDDLLIVENAYTKKQKKAGKIPSATVDSVVVWLPTRPERPYTFVFIPKYGWSALLARTQQSTAYIYSDAEYIFRPDGRMWFLGTETLIIDRNGEISDLWDPFGIKPDKYASKIAKISGGDTELEARLKYLLGQEYPSNYVRVIKMNGDTICGYIREDEKREIKKAFALTSSLMQSVIISEEPEGKGTRYSADEVSEVQWLNDNIAPVKLVSMSMHTPSLFKLWDFTRGFPWLWDRRSSGSIVRWEVWDLNMGPGRMMYLVPAVSVYFEGTKGAFLLYSNGHIDLSRIYKYMKEKAPEFHNMLKEYYDKSPDKKAHRKELKDNPSTILLLYEEYLKTHDLIDDRPDPKNE